MLCLTTHYSHDRVYSSTLRFEAAKTELVHAILIYATAYEDLIKKAVAETSKKNKDLWKTANWICFQTVHCDFQS